MKTREFANKLKDYGLYGKRHLSCFTGVINISTIGSINDPVLADISDDEVGVVKFNVPINRKDIVDIIMEYANTPIKERMEENKYLVHLKGVSDYTGYLNYRKDLKFYFIDKSNEDEYIKSHFTKYEIDELVEDPNFFLQKGSYTLED